MTTPTEPPQGGCRAGGRILLVDDLDSNRFLLGEALADLGAEILTAASGKRALDIVSASRPEVVVLDFQMPDLNGAETSRRIKSQVGAPFTYVILMSGYREAEQAGILGRSQADRFLAKPYAVSEVRAAVREGLRVAGDRRSATTS